VIDKANRLYQMPPEIGEFISNQPRRGPGGRLRMIDLATFSWPPEFGADCNPGPDQLLPASTEKIEALREELAAWLTRRHGTRILPDKELYIGGGISNLIYLLTLAYVDAGDVAFVPGLGIPTYRSCVNACNGEPIPYTISAKSDWTPRFDRLNTNLGRIARLLFLNSPHNPTGHELSEKEMAELAWLAGRLNIMLVNDAAYGEVMPRAPISLLDVTGSKKVGVELSSFSYQFGLPPLPFGYAVGSREAISGLKKASRLVKNYLPEFFIDLALDAIRQFPGPGLTAVRDRIDRTGAAATKLLDLLKLERSGQPTVPFIWARIEQRTPSTSLAKMLRRRFGLTVAPGISLGENGEGFLRFSLLTGPEAYTEAAKRVAKGRLLGRKAE
jgi:aspartate/methionine/tyrosine aminotransferase